MKRLICSAAVASALLAVTAVPSGARSLIALPGGSSVAGTNYDTVSLFVLHCPRPNLVVVISGSNPTSVILTFTGSPRASQHYSIRMHRFAHVDGLLLSPTCSGTMPAGTYTLVVGGTGGTSAVSAFRSSPASSPLAVPSPDTNSWNIGTLLERLGPARFLGLGQGTEGRLRIGFIRSSGLLR